MGWRDKMAKITGADVGREAPATPTPPVPVVPARAQPENLPGVKPEAESARPYIKACLSIVRLVNDGAKRAQDVLSIRGRLAEANAGPQLAGTPIAIRNFNKMIEDLGGELRATFAQLQEAKALAKVEAAKLIESHSSGIGASGLITLYVDDDTKETVTQATGVLLVDDFSHTPEAFMAGVAKASALLDSDEDFGFTFVYQPKP